MTCPEHSSPSLTLTFEWLSQFELTCHQADILLYALSQVPIRPSDSTSHFTMRFSKISLSGCRERSGREEVGDVPFAFACARVSACVWGTGQMWPLNELWILTLEASYIRFEPRWRSETKCTTVTQPEEAYYTTVDEASPLTPLKYTFMIHNASNCAHRSHLHPFFVLSSSCFWSFLSVGGWKTHKTTFCHAMTKNTRCKLYIFISVRDDMVFVNILFIVGFTAYRIHCKNRCKLIQPITSLHPRFWRPLLDFHLKVYRY